MRKLFLVFTLAASAVSVFAQSDDRTLPAFTVSDGAGRDLSSAELAAGGRSVLVFVKPSCRPCEQLLGAMARVAEAGGAPRLVVIVESPTDTAAGYARALPQPLANVPWFADASGEGWRALNVKGLPVVLGVDGSEVAWTHIGVPQRSLLESLMRGWAGTQGVAR